MREHSDMKVRIATKLALLFVFVLVVIIGYQTNSQAVTKHKVVWQSKVGDETQIFMMDLENPASQKQLTKVEYGAKHPTIPNSGKRLYYYRFYPTPWGDGDTLCYMDLPDGMENLVQRNAIHFEHDPSVSRDGKVLAYCSKQIIPHVDKSENWEIVLLKTDFSEIKRITSEINEDMDPFLSGNGQRVYYTIEVVQDRTETEKNALRDEAKEKDKELDEESDEFLQKKLYFIYRNTFAADNLERITPRDYNAWHPSVDSGENFMAFQSTMDGNDDIYIMDLASYEVTRLTTEACYDGNPCISSDGKEIVFVSDRDGDKEIFSMDRFGKNVVQLTENDVEDDDPFIT
jgi:TolB protein